MNRIVLITGGTKGIGLAVAQAFLAKGDIVIGASRRPAEVPFPTHALDLSSEESIRECVGWVAREYGRIDILVNSAGMGIGGPLEDYSDAQLQRECQLNFIGTARMICAVLPYMRAQNAGKIISIGSVAARIPIPFQSMYSASKAALASMTGALRLELKGTGVSLCVVEPGDTATGFTAAREFAAGTGQHSCYQAPCEHALNAMMHDEIHGKSPETVARAVVRLAGKRRMPARRVVCMDYKLLCLAARLLPVRVVEWVLGLLYLKSKKDAGYRYAKK
ncbi:SDR family NAD(P)-dependent oxidoreductase [Christensenellaceae bacterium NSJ-63]|uniref:SDR family NAD(P)-dependent oxidoreductase n=1 Tax=Guopingia tenuis TaxID=2763656 RepID=A0A926HWV4_9FIRM|nr:SDR family NAD(P)-dependent oxidoreductase [Guopingia tenuis]MBC8538086.1 SDR family NAD(P)-dependent oxidoreductase [Guopingia tenuis]